MTPVNIQSLNIGIIGASISGLASALSLANAGHRIHVFERDRASLPENPITAFSTWHRPGVPQLRHSHAFLARLRNLLRDRFPTFLERLLNAGAREIPIEQLLNPELTNQITGDWEEDLVLIASRRATFEWALHAEAKDHPNVTIDLGQKIFGFTRERTVSRVSGVRTTDGSIYKTDLIIDSSGRNTEILRWLKDVNLPQPRTERRDCGIFYCTRFFRDQKNKHVQTMSKTIAADLGFMKYAVFHGDGGIFSVTLAASPDDENLTRIIKTKGFEKACRAVPQVAKFTEGAIPVGEVRAISGLESIKRSFSDDAPHGLILLGDSLIHTNPLYGRGATMAFLQANLLTEVLKTYRPSNELALTSILDLELQKEIYPWYELGLSQDENSIRVAQKHRSEKAAKSTRPDGTLDPREYMQTFIREGLIPVMAKDGLVARKAFRGFHMMDKPGSLMKDPEVIKRVTSYFRKNKNRRSRVRFTRKDLIFALDS
tara:strand:+ start:2471 stop:3928 length:1458 start_codon:yes stop_codon:yes gene_type:complete